ncbi:hypothetical protein [Lysobacter gummosus]
MTSKNRRTTTEPAALNGLLRSLRLRAAERRTSLTKAPKSIAQPWK